MVHHSSAFRTISRLMHHLPCICYLCVQDCVSDYAILLSGSTSGNTPPDEHSCFRRLPLLVKEDRMKVRVWVGTSRIAGKGLFAAQEIKKGTRIMQYIEQRISKAKTAERFYQGNQYIFGLHERYALDGDTPKNTLSFGRLKGGFSP